MNTYHIVTLILILKVLASKSKKGYKSQYITVLNTL